MKCTTRIPSGINFVFYLAAAAAAFYYGQILVPVLVVSSWSFLPSHMLTPTTRNRSLSSSRSTRVLFNDLVLNQGVVFDHKRKPLLLSSTSRTGTRTVIMKSSNNNHHNHDEAAFHDDNDNGMKFFNGSYSFNMVDQDSDLLRHRLNQMRAELLSRQIQLPPNPDLSPEEFITILLEQLHNPCMPQSGVRALIRSSSKEWRSKLRKSIGVPRNIDIDEETFVNALASAISRPHNQYEILVQDSDDGSGDATYALYFPGDVVDYHDGRCWIETQLRHPVNGKLFVIIGWSLVRDESGAWLVEGLDWQDFRDEFRPGIGREEWMRICG